LAGDHQQLPPTITSPQAEKGGLSVTLFDRTNQLFGEQVTRMLTVQYRMHQAIMNYPSQELYQGKLVADESVKLHLLKDIPKITSNNDTTIPLVLIDTAGCNMQEMKEEEGVRKPVIRSSATIL
jgi:superfamily I DNA and/or RNA helicase